MRPYYSTERATLYLGDAREVLPTLPRGSVDLIATDPPYGVSWQSNYSRRDGFEGFAGDDGSLDVPAVLGASIIALRPHRHVYVFGYSPDQLAEPLRLSATADLVWDKKLPGLGRLDAVWAPSHERVTFGVYAPSKAGRAKGRGNLSARLRRGSVLRVQRPNACGVTRHPTEKPVALMRQLIESSTALGDTVLDPFAGSGSTLVAAVLTGRRAVGVEIDPRYAEIAAERLRAAEEIAARIEAA